MGEDGWDAGFGQPEAVFEDVGYAFYAEPAADEHYCEGDIELDAIVESQDAKLADTLPARLRVHDGDLHESVQIGKLENSNQEIIENKPKLILLLFLLLFPFLILPLHNPNRLHSKIFPRLDIFPLDHSLLFFYFLAAVFAGLVFFIDF